MIIYKDKSGNVISVGNYVESAIAVDISDDPKACEYYSSCTNCTEVRLDGSTVHYILPPAPKQTTTEELMMEVDKLNEIIDTLILSSLEDDDV